MLDALWVEILTKPVFVLISQNSDGDPTAEIFETEGGKLVMGFSSVLNLARFCETGSQYIEMSAQELLPWLVEQDISLGFEFGTETGAILSPEQLRAMIAELDYSSSIETSSNLSFVPMDDDEWLSQELGKLIVGFDPQPRVYVANSAEQGVIICVLKPDLVQHFGLLAQLEEIARRHPHHERLHILAVDVSRFAIMQDFNIHAILVQPIMEVVPEHPPILKY